MRPPRRARLPRPHVGHEEPDLHQGVRDPRDPLRGEQLTRGRDTTRGLVATTGAFAIWGLIPLYWKLLGTLPATEVLAHRIAWSLPCLLALLALRGRGSDFLQVLAGRRTRWLLLTSTALITINWLAFLWAITHDRVLDSSLGYYINPLVSVFLGFAVLGERLGRRQWVAVALATVGVALLTARQGVPWISLTLAFSFGSYGLVRKLADVRPMLGLLIEIAILTPPSVGYLVWLASRGEGAFGSAGVGSSLLLAAAGPITVVPLLMFNAGVRSLSLATVGFLQYMTPTGHFLLAVTVFGEPFDLPRLAAFGFIWTALGVYTFDLRRRLGRGPRPRQG